MYVQRKNACSVAHTSAKQSWSFSGVPFERMRKFQKREKKQAKALEKGIQPKELKKDETIPLDTVITLDLLTANKTPDKK